MQIQRHSNYDVFQALGSILQKTIEVSNSTKSIGNTFYSIGTNITEKLYNHSVMLFDALSIKVNLLIEYKSRLVEAIFDNIIDFAEYLAENGNTFLTEQISEALNKPHNFDPSMIQLMAGKIIKSVSNFFYKLLNSTLFDIRTALQVIITNTGSGIVMVGVTAVTGYFGILPNNLILQTFNWLNIAPTYQAQVTEYLGHWAINWLTKSGVWLLGTFQLNFHLIDRTMVSRYNHRQGWNQQMPNKCKNFISRFLSKWRFFGGWCSTEEVLKLPHSIGKEIVPDAISTSSSVQQTWDELFMNTETFKNETLFEKLRNFTLNLRAEMDDNLLNLL